MIPPALNDFYTLPVDRRDEILVDEITSQHRWHYEHNRAYRLTVSLRGVGPDVSEEQLHRLLRVSAIFFKSYIEQLGTPFPQERAPEFVQWILDHVSIKLNGTDPARIRPGYRNLESLLCAVEKLFRNAGVEIVTSSGTSGKAAILVRDSSSNLSPPRPILLPSGTPGVSDPITI